MWAEEPVPNRRGSDTAVTRVKTYEKNAPPPPLKSPMSAAARFPIAAGLVRHESSRPKVRAAVRTVAGRTARIAGVGAVQASAG